MSELRAARALIALVTEHRKQRWGVGLESGLPQQVIEALDEFNAKCPHAKATPMTYDANAAITRKIVTEPEFRRAFLGDPAVTFVIHGKWVIHRATKLCSIGEEHSVATCREWNA